MKARYVKVRDKTEQICSNLSEGELSIQPRTEVSPAKWHLGHTTWFFEKVILEKYLENYVCFNTDYNFIFNSYYKQIGMHINQSERGEIGLESAEILAYREHIDRMMLTLLEQNVSEEVNNLVAIGLNHEEQHQELLHMDIKAVFFRLNKEYTLNIPQNTKSDESWLEIPEGIIECGESGDSFCYDNEKPRHKHFQYEARISNRLVSNNEFAEFIDCGGYGNPKYWLSKGWDWVKENNVLHPLYWSDSLAPFAPVAHISYFEADAYANWAGLRLPTEYEHEYFDQIKNTPQNLWSWTSSHYSPYPGFKKFDGELSEYNGKFMCNQFVLRGGCIATPEKHWRPSYRNFYEPHQRWMYSGIRLAKDI